MGVSGGFLPRPAGLAFLAVAGPLVVAAHLSDHLLARVGLTVLVMLFPVALIAIALRPGAPGAWKFLGALGALLVGTGLGLLFLPATGPLLLGLPAAALLMLLGLWCLPLVLAVGVYAATFPRWTLEPDDLERLRRRVLAAGAARRDDDAAG